MLPRPLRRIVLAAPVSSETLGPRPLISVRFKRYEAYDAQFDQEALADARSWYRNFDASQLPHGSTTYARSSGPGGQHVNKTETKAITTIPVKELLAMLPQALHSGVRASKYYTAGSDCLTFHAQTQRSRTANAEENRSKLMEEVTRLFQDKIPAETSNEKKKKHEEIAKKFHTTRIKTKKLMSSKKQHRRGQSD
ncbi:hypothetical protein CDD83_10599 [Cordyceps sp. RAO-2017]|nr:hypothetical protein CDD83_10599 [Cordyceps sp. RAO-2017]